MTAKNTALAVVDAHGQLPIVPNAEDFAALPAEAQDMDRLPYGRIKIAAAGVTVFQVYEPGDEEPHPEQSVEGVIRLSHRSNALWLQDFSGENAQPDCTSADGTTGVRTATGEIVNCAACPYNQFGSAKGGTGRGKQCKNSRRLLIMRRGDIFPLSLLPPPSAIAAFDGYRTRVMLSRHRLMAVLTRITLKSTKNRDGIAYSSPVFEAVGALNEEEKKAVEEYAATLNESAARVGVTADDFVPVDAPDNPFVVPEPPARQVPAGETDSMDVFQAIE